MPRTRDRALTSDRFIYMLQQLDDFDEPQSYSGRFMYGERCVSIIVPGVASLAMLGAQLVMGADDDDERERIVHLLRSTKIDSMGKSDVVLYWPDMGMKDEDEDD